MEIVWFGHSCFLLKSSLGKRILMDPFSNVFNYPNDFPKSDILTISHYHFNHSYINKKNNNCKIINCSGNYTLGNINIMGLDSFHDNFKGLKRGTNVIYVINIDNIRICHLGDIGHIPTPSLLNIIKDVDVIMIPVGGHFTIDGIQASKICKMISPKIILPMHYKTNSSLMKLDTCKKFIFHMKSIKKINSNIINISYPLHNNSEVILLNPPNKN